MAKPKNKIGVVKGKIGTVKGSGAVKSALGTSNSTTAWKGLSGEPLASVISGLEPVNTINQYGPTDYTTVVTQTEPEVVTASTTTSSSIDIYMNYMEASNTANNLNDIADILNESCNKLDSLLTDANNYWKSSAATLFTSKVEEYILSLIHI